MAKKLSGFTLYSRASLFVGVSLVVVIVLGICIWVYIHQSSDSVYTFAQCQSQPGSHLLETYPEQCTAATGQTFTNTDQSVPVE